MAYIIYCIYMVTQDPQNNKIYVLPIYMLLFGLACFFNFDEI